MALPCRNTVIEKNNHPKLIIPFIMCDAQGHFKTTVESSLIGNEFFMMVPGYCIIRDSVRNKSSGNILRINRNCAFRPLIR
jgi:hypothetical protein